MPTVTALAALLALSVELAGGAVADWEGLSALLPQAQSPVHISAARRNAVSRFFIGVLPFITAAVGQCAGGALKIRLLIQL
jgi:hypothetical protein